MHRTSRTRCPLSLSEISRKEFPPFPAPGVHMTRVHPIAERVPVAHSQELRWKHYEYEKLTYPRFILPTIKSLT